MEKEIRIPASELQDVQTVTQRNIRAMQEHGLDIHLNEVTEMADDPDEQVRVLKVKTRTAYVFT